MRPAARAGREIWFQEARNIQGYPRIYHVYTSNDIPCISMDIPCIYFVDIPCISLDIHGISTTMDIHGISKDIPCIYHTYTRHMDEDTIWMVYTRHIPGIYQKSWFQMSRCTTVSWSLRLEYDKSGHIPGIFLVHSSGTLRYMISYMIS